MCAPLSSYASNLCNQYRTGAITLVKLGKYLQVAKISQDEYDTIIDPECDCGWIVPAARAVDE